MLLGLINRAPPICAALVLIATPSSVIAMRAIDERATPEHIGAPYDPPRVRIGREDASTADVASGNRLLFQSHLYDYDADLYLARARVLDPFTGSFMQRDPFGYEDSVNLYAGFKHDAVNVRDPTGQIAWLPFIAGAGLLTWAASSGGDTHVDVKRSNMNWRVFKGFAARNLATLMTIGALDASHDLGHSIAFGHSVEEGLFGAVGLDEADRNGVSGLEDATMVLGAVEATGSWTTRGLSWLRRCLSLEYEFDLQGVGSSLAREMTSGAVDFPIRRGPTRAQVRGLKDLGLSRETRRAFLQGQHVIAEFPTEGGSPTTVIFQLSNTRLSAGIFHIRNQTGGGLKAFSDFRGRARMLAELFGAQELELQGIAVLNPKIEQVLKKLGFVTRTVDVPGELGGGTIDVFSKIFRMR